MENIFDADDALLSDLLAPANPLRAAASEGELVSKLYSVIQNLGFDKAMFAVIPDPLKDANKVYLRSNYPEAWRQHYEKTNMRAVDPTVEYCFRSSTPFIWMPQCFKTPEQRAMYEEASAFGLRGGVTLPIHGPRGEVGMLTCVSDRAPNLGFVKDLQHHLGGLALLRDIAFESMSKFIRGDVADVKKPILTARELECLQWMAAGKTAWEIGRILGISEAGANFHVANMRNKFGVSKRNDVVLRAIRLGMISLS